MAQLPGSMVERGLGLGTDKLALAQDKCCWLRCRVKEAMPSAVATP